MKFLAPNQGTKDLDTQNTWTTFKKKKIKIKFLAPNQ